jgi:electron-transferring-flavoprotein dehydrogenase
MSAAGWPAKAEALGVEIYPGFAAAEVLYNEKGAVPASPPATWASSATASRPAYARGMELLGKYVLIGEGVRGSLAKQLIAKFKLDEGREPQKFGIGLKELWQVKPENHKPGLVQHSFGWPLDMKTGGGSFLYHLEDNSGRGRLRRASQLQEPVPLALRGVPALQDASGDPRHLRGRQAHLLRRARHHRGRLAVGAEALLPGRRADRLLGRLRQRAAHQGFAQRGAVRHAGGRACRRALAAGRANDELAPTRPPGAPADIGKDLKKVRNVKPLWSKLRHLSSASALGGLDMWTNTLFGVSPFGTLKHGKTDAPR